MKIISAPPLHLDYVETTTLLANVALATISQNAVFLCRVRLDSPLVVSKFYVFVGTTDGAASIDVGAYLFDGTTFTLIGHCGAQGTQTGSAVNEFSPTAACVLPASGQLFLGVGTSSATLTTYRAAAASGLIAAQGNKYLTKASAYSSGLPATITGAVSTGTLPWIGARE